MTQPTKQSEANSKQEKITHQPCIRCEGKGYTEIRDCAGEIQRTETCSFCEGTGNLDQLSI